MGLRSIIKNELVRVEDSAEPHSTSSQPHRNCAKQPSARIVELEGRARAIQVVCGCGSELLIELDYDELANDPS